MISLHSCFFIIKCEIKLLEVSREVPENGNDSGREYLARAEVAEGHHDEHQCGSACISNKAAILLKRGTIS